MKHEAKLKRLEKQLPPRKPVRKVQLPPDWVTRIVALGAERLVRLHKARLGYAAGECWDHLIAEALAELP